MIKALASFLLVGVMVSLAAAFMVGAERKKPAVEPNPAELAYIRGSFVMRFTEEPCPYEEVTDQLNNDGIPPAKAYRELLGDGRWALPGCWVRDLSGDLMTMTTVDRDTKTIPAEWLTPPRKAPSSR